jgi:glycosyltransferase involved in cell wall biosynthesis
MKIGIFLPNATFDLPGSPEVGGIETFSFTIGEALLRMGHDVVLFGGQPKAGRTHRATSIPLELHPYWETKSIPDLGTRFQRLVQRLHFAWSTRHAWDDHRCDVALLAKPFDWPVAWWWKRKRPELKVIMGFNGTDFFAGDRKFYSAVDAAFAVSNTVADLVEARVGKRPVLIPNPVDADFFKPSPAIKKKSTGWHLVSSGRLVGWKGFGNLVEAVARLRDEQGITAQLSLAGDGPERGNLLAQIAKLNLASQVTLCGLLSPEPLRDLLRTGDLYVLPSIGMEAFSISALEGGCVGLPLLLSDQVGLGGHLTGADAAIYPARDVGALVSHLKNLHEHRYDAKWIDVDARHARLRELFAPERVAKRILDLLN